LAADPFSGVVLGSKRHAKRTQISQRWRKIQQPNHLSREEIRSVKETIRPESVQ
jgi:hypothetical protein